MTQRLFAAIIALLVMGSAAAPPTVSPGELAGASNRFGFDLFRTLTAEKLDKNVFISPYSVSTALTMTWGGARGATARDMAKMLRFDGTMGKGVYRAADSLRKMLASDTNVTLAIANSLWLRQGLVLKPDYLGQTRKSFGAELSVLDFDDPTSVGIINGWVKRNTRGKIETIIERITPDLRLYLINAVYFKGTWQVQFDPARTEDLEFYPLAGPARQRPMMRQAGHYLYFKGADFQAVKLPYRGGGTCMYVFLPDSRNGITSFVRRMTDDNWQRWTGAMVRRRGELALPRLTAAYEADLSQQLTQLGMGMAFSDNADFSGISDKRLAISEVRHKAVLEINEEGTVAAAVTSVGMRTTSIIPEAPPFTMIVDHPFFLAIAEEATGAILFMGAIVDPD